MTFNERFYFTNEEADTLEKKNNERASLIDSLKPLWEEMRNKTEKALASNNKEEQDKIQEEIDSFQKTNIAPLTKQLEDTFAEINSVLKQREDRYTNSFAHMNDDEKTKEILKDITFITGNFSRGDFEAIIDMINRTNMFLELPEPLKAKAPRKTSSAYRKTLFGRLNIPIVALMHYGLWNDKTQKQVDSILLDASRREYPRGKKGTRLDPLSRLGTSITAPFMRDAETLLRSGGSYADASRMIEMSNALKKEKGNSQVRAVKQTEDSLIIIGTDSKKKLFNASVLRTAGEQLSNEEKKLGKESLKVFYFILQEASKVPGISSKEHTGASFTFHIQSLVDSGAYASQRTARTAINKAITPLSRMQFNIRSDSPSNAVRGVMNLFSTIVVKNSVCYVTLNPDILNQLKNDPKGSKIFFLNNIPSYFSSLSIDAQQVLRNALLTFRENRTKKPGKTGTATLLYRNIQSFLGLPREDEVKDIGGRIIKPIERIAKEINEKEQELRPGNPGIIIETEPFNNRSAREVLNQGRLVITLKGESFEALTGLNESLEKKQKALEETKERKKTPQEKS